MSRPGHSRKREKGNTSNHNTRSIREEPQNIKRKKSTHYTKLWSPRLDRIIKKSEGKSHIIREELQNKIGPDMVRNRIFIIVKTNQSGRGKTKQ